MRISDWSSDVCSSDLKGFGAEPAAPRADAQAPIWADGPSASVLSTLSGPAPSRGAADEDDGLADRLATARDGAQEASVAAGRSRAALYRALSLAYDFHLDRKSTRLNSSH